MADPRHAANCDGLCCSDRGQRSLVDELAEHSAYGVDVWRRTVASCGGEELTRAAARTVAAPAVPLSPALIRVLVANERVRRRVGARRTEATAAAPASSAYGQGSASIGAVLEQRWCRYCGAAIVWALTALEAWQALDAASDGGSVAVSLDYKGNPRGRVVSAEYPAHGHERLYTPHAATCTNRPARPPATPRAGVLDLGDARRAPDDRRAKKAQGVLFP